MGVSQKEMIGKEQNYKVSEHFSHEDPEELPHAEVTFFSHLIY